MLDLIRWYARGKTKSLGRFLSYLDLHDAKYITISFVSTKWRDGEFWSHDDHITIRSDSDKTFTLTMVSNRGPGSCRHDNDEAVARVKAVATQLAGIIGEVVPGIRVIFKDALGSRDFKEGN